MSAPAILTFTAAGAEVAGAIATLTGGAIEPCGARGHDARDVLARCFAEGVSVIGVCSAGILIRLVAPLLGDKHGEPPVLAVSSDGAHVVPLLGGHRGANRLAREIASALGGTAALTTASDSRFSRSLDEPPAGWTLATPAGAKSAMASLLGGASIRLSGDAPFLAEAGYPVSPDGAVTIAATESSAASADIVYRPRTLIAGLGCERGTEAGEIVDLLERTLADAGLARESLAAIGSIDIKADERGLHAAAARFGVPLRLFSAAELDAERGRLANPSAVVDAEIGVAGVAEAVALKAGELIVPKVKSKRATCAIGKAARPLDPYTLGRAPGVVHIVGIGPGDARSRTRSAVEALLASTDWVGYGLYLDLVSDLRGNRQEHRFPLGAEEERVRHALELAGTGRTVALICSGDGQIFAMAALVFELLEAAGSRAVSAAARTVSVVSHPGISAFQAASARLGALIGHDFCAISLSDLLTPREHILKRLEAAAAADFVTALYNPRSLRRTDLIARARAIFLAHRPADTPVLVASNIGRADEKLAVTTLSSFEPGSIDMLTIVLFGAASSRALTRGDGITYAYTPRGYASKARS